MPPGTVDDLHAEALLVESSQPLGLGVVKVDMSNLVGPVCDPGVVSVPRRPRDHGETAPARVGEVKTIPPLDRLA